MKNLTPELQADLVAGLRAAVPKICEECAESNSLSPAGTHWVLGTDSMGRFVRREITCPAKEARLLLARVDAEIAAQAAERKA